MQCEPANKEFKRAQELLGLIMAKSYRAISVFLMLLAAALTVYIGTTIVTVYKNNKNESMTLAQTLTSECVGMSYAVSDLAYDGYELSFNLTNRDDSIENIPSITVKGLNERSKELKNFLPDITRRVTVSDIQIADNFTIYSANCVGFSRICYLSTGSCENIIG